MDLPCSGSAEHGRTKGAWLAITRVSCAAVIETVHKDFVALQIKIGLPEKVGFGMHATEEIAQALAVSEAVDPIRDDIAAPDPKCNNGVSKLLVPLLLRDLPSHALETPCSSQKPPETPVSILQLSLPAEVNAVDGRDYLVRGLSSPLAGWART